MATKLCKHCQQPITHDNKYCHPIYCNRKECARERSTLSVKTNRIKRGVVHRKCHICGKNIDVPRDTPFGEATCPSCLENNKTIDDKDMCEVCGKRRKHPGFKKMCWLCHITEGDYDADSQLYGHGYLG